MPIGHNGLFLIIMITLWKNYSVIMKIKKHFEAVSNHFQWHEGSNDTSFEKIIVFFDIFSHKYVSENKLLLLVNI